jgi:predicted Zn-dependent protease
VLAGRREEAARELDSLSKEAPGDRDVRASRAYLLLESGAADGAKKAMEEMRALIGEKDDESALHYHLGRGLLFNGDTDGARKEWLRAVQLDGADVRPRIALARLALNTGDPASALRQADELLQVYVRHPEIEMIRASALIATSRFNDARTTLEGLRKRYPGNPAVEIESAFLALAEGAYNEAERGFRRLYRAGDANSRPMLGLVQTLVLAGKRPDALRLLEDDLKAAPGRPAVQIALAEGYAASGEKDKAVALLESIIKAEPRAVPAYRLLAGIQVSENRLGDAIELLKSAAAQNPGNADLLSFLGDAQFADGRLEDAEKSLREALASAPTAHRARIALALVLAEGGTKLDEAMQYAQEALKAAPSDLAARDSVAYVYLKQKRTADALQTLRALAQQSPREPLYRYHYGLALAQSGETGQARAEFEAALAQKPPPFLEKRIRAAQR